MLVKKIKYYSLLICLVLSGAIYSQYDTTHYIPYFGDLTKQSNAKTNLEFETDRGGAYIMFSTFESGPVNVKVYKRIGYPGNGWMTTLPIYDEDISPGQPIHGL